MQAQNCTPAQFEFYFANLDSLVLVETREREVIIRATRNSFSEERKVSFIHELAAEGFIPDNYRWFSSFTSTSTSELNVRWLVDISWLSHNAARTTMNRLMIRTIIGAALLWLAMMALFFLH
jgi:hypothetical protein